VGFLEAGRPVPCAAEQDLGLGPRPGVSSRRYRYLGLMVALSSIDATVKAKTEVTVQLTEKQRRERARQMILEAFRERPPRLVEGEYKVIGGRDVAADVASANERVNSEAEGTS